MIDFIDVDRGQTELLRDILIESKGYWGYSSEQLGVWKSALRFDPEYISNNTVKLIVKDSDVIGFYALTLGETDELDHLWLLPSAIGLGHGRITFQQVLSECIALNICEFYVISDPDAEGFYLKMGAARVGEVYSEAQNRMLPKLKYLVMSAKK